MNARQIEGEFKTAFLFIAVGVTGLGAFLIGCGHPASAIGFPMTGIGASGLVAHGLCKFDEWRWHRRTRKQ